MTHFPQLDRLQERQDQIRELPREETTEEVLREQECNALQVAHFLRLQDGN